MFLSTVDGNWSTWGGWQECSVTCGGGDKTRNRTCTDPIPQYSGEDCHGNDTEVAICNAILCPSKTVIYLLLICKLKNSKC